MLNVCLLLVFLSMIYMMAVFFSDVDGYNRLLSAQWCKKNIEGVYSPSDDKFSYYGVYVYAQRSDAGDITIKAKVEDIRRTNIWQLHRMTGSTEIATVSDMDVAVKEWGGSIFCKGGGAYIGESQVHIPYVFRN